MKRESFETTQLKADLLKRSTKSILSQMHRSVDPVELDALESELTARGRVITYSRSGVAVLLY